MDSLSLIDTNIPFIAHSCGCHGLCRSNIPCPGGGTDWIGLLDSQKGQEGRKKGLQGHTKKERQHENCSWRLMLARWSPHKHCWKFKVPCWVRGFSGAFVCVTAMFNEWIHDVYIYIYNGFLRLSMTPLKCNSFHSIVGCFPMLDFTFVRRLWHPCDSIQVGWAFSATECHQNMSFSASAERIRSKRWKKTITQQE